jgi:hypothetical protein
MTEQAIDNVEFVEDNEPIYYKPKSLNLIATLAGVFSWIVLVGFIADIVVQVINIQSQLQQQSLALGTLMAEPSFNSYAFTYLVIPLMTGLALFAILQGVSIGLNVLLEIDFNIREPKN